jgi:hypothetical protein
MHARERGQALMMSIVAVSVVLLVLLTALTVTQYSGKLLQKQLLYQGQALNAASAGLTDALSWFRRQPLQPVTNFAPAGADTDVAATGLVREYAISTPSNVWAHYELQKTAYTPPATPLPFAPSATRNKDITWQRLKNGNGIVWQLESHGYVFIRNNSNILGSTSDLGNARPNKILAHQALRSEIQRLALNLPAQSAISVSRNHGITFGVGNLGYAKVRGNSGIAIAWENRGTGTGSPCPAAAPACPNVTISGAVSSTAIPANSGSFTIPAIFATTPQDLKATASLVLSGASAFDASNRPNVCQNILGCGAAPTPLSVPKNWPPSMQLVVIDAPAAGVVFDNTIPLAGSGIVVINGNATMTAGMNNAFNGLLVVRGTLAMNAGCIVNGAVVVDPGNPNNGSPAGPTASIALSGLAGNFAEVRYDSQLLNQVAQQIGVYNFSRTPYVP